MAHPRTPPTSETNKPARALEALIAVRTKRRRRCKPRKQPPYAVVLHNDDVNGFGFVVDSLRKVFGYAMPQAYRLTLQAHLTGRSIVWSGLREHAELKAEQLTSCGPDPAEKARRALPLRVTVEAQP